MIKIPTKEECLDLLRRNKVPHNIIAHTKKVCEFSLKVCGVLEEREIKVNRNLVAAAALLHDIKKLEPGEHEIEGAKYIKSLGYPEVADLIKKHGLKYSLNDEFTPITWEEKIIFYSDKRVKNDKIVSIDERFEYIKQRYKTEDVEKELKFTKDIEKELLGNKIL
ncbi:MAG TPA: HD domain-containing protein [Candidatus Nanoarchaeia archaeon]|nr:HD domain-containing protein [Candidatus Nanoarchaeia archaeon]